jgi:hypothetical protein
MFPGAHAPRRRPWEPEAALAPSPAPNMPACFSESAYHVEGVRIGKAAIANRPPSLFGGDESSP